MKRKAVSVQPWMECVTCDHWKPCGAFQLGTCKPKNGTVTRADDGCDEWKEADDYPTISKT